MRHQLATGASRRLSCIRATGGAGHVVLRAVCTRVEPEGFVVVAEVGTGDDAVRAAEEHAPDVVLVDLQLGPAPGEPGGAEAARPARALAGAPLVLVLTDGDVAEELGTNEPTVEPHLVRVVTEPDVTSRTAAIARARDRGVLR